MAKRISRSRSRSAQTGGQAVRPSGRPAMAVATPEELAAQYSYVVRDLGRIAVIAAVLIGGLIVLSFFIK